MVKFSISRQIILVATLILTSLDALIFYENISPKGNETRNVKFLFNTSQLGKPEGIKMYIILDTSRDS